MYLTIFPRSYYYSYYYFYYYKVTENCEITNTVLGNKTLGDSFFRPSLRLLVENVWSLSTGILL